VLGAGALTTWLVASAVGPGLFREHLARAGDTHSAVETDHMEQAFGSALLVSVGVALLAAFIAALAVSWYFSRRVQRSIGAVTDAAADIAAGRYDTRVPEPGLGAEFETLAASYNQLASRLETTETIRRRMLADLAHEMRTPLATIEAHLEAVEDNIRPLPETLAIVRSSTGRLGRLAQDMAALSRAEEGTHLHRTPVDAAGLAAAAADAARDRYTAAGVHLQAHIEPSGHVDVDADRIGQVLANLLDNALRHTPAQGTVTLTCHRGQGRVEYRVSDTGAGVSPEHLPPLFDRFYRADTSRDRERGGSGLGLAIAKALVEAHGGAISAASAGPGQGATFTVQLPEGP
jgi:signal transduction histidine kinase